MKIEVDLDETKYGYIEPQVLEKVREALRIVRGRLWAEAYYDPANETTRSFASGILAELAPALELLRVAV